MDAKVEEELERLFKQSPNDVMEWFWTLEISRWPDVSISNFIVEIKPGSSNTFAPEV